MKLRLYKNNYLATCVNNRNNIEVDIFSSFKNFHNMNCNNRKKD